MFNQTEKSADLIRFNQLINELIDLPDYAFCQRKTVKTELYAVMDRIY